MRGLKVKVYGKELEFNEKVEIIEIKIKPTIKLMANILDHFPNIRKIEISLNLYNYLDEKVWNTIRDMGIEVKLFDVYRGRKSKHSNLYDKICKEREKGNSIRKISKRLGIPKTTIHRILKSFCKN